GTAYLSIPSEAIENATWEFFVKLTFNPSSTNYTRIFLTSDQQNLSGILNGYFVMIGGTADEVSLYRQSGSVTTKIIDGKDGRTDTALVMLKLKVTRSETGDWQLFSDAAITGSYELE